MATRARGGRAGDAAMEPGRPDVPAPPPSVTGGDASPRARRLDVTARGTGALRDGAEQQRTLASASGDVAIGMRMLLHELGATHAQLRLQAAELSTARSALKAEQARYRALFEVAREGHVVTDGHGVVLECNHSAAALLNVPPEYLIGKPLSAFVRLDDRPHLRVRVYRSRELGVAQEWTATLTPRDIPELRVSVLLSPVAQDETPVTLRWLLRDVSGSRSDVVASREPATILRAALDALSAHVAVIDPDGRILTVNRAWEAAAAPAGIFPSGVGAGTSYLELCESACRAGVAGAARVRDAVMPVLRGTEPRADVVYTVGERSDSTLHNSWFALRVARCDGPAPLKVVVTHEDITAERVAYARERALLEERVARSAAEAASRAKSEFLATLSHELRTPLNAIAGYAQLLEMGVRGPITPQQAEDLGRILRSERHLLGLINELLNFSRVERGEVTLTLAPIRLVDVMTEVLELIEPQAASRGLQTAIECRDADVSAQADAEKVRQILLNVLSNALKFTPRGGTIRIECDGDDTHAFIRVHDTGVGIPSDRLGEIFDPFVQVHRGSGEPTEGIGLGLAISRTLARAMDGELRASSDVGKGSSFELMLPRARVRVALT